MRYYDLVRNVRKYWPASPSHFERPLLVGVGRASGRTRSFVVNNGLSFQRKVTAHFDRMEGWFCLPELEIRYLDRGEEYKAFIDLVCINPVSGWVVVVECKRTHTSSSYGQLWRYMAYLASRFGGRQWKFAGFEACSLSGRSIEYPGPCVWLNGGEINLEPFSWSGEGAPMVGILPWYVTDDWRFK